MNSLAAVVDEIEQQRYFGQKIRAREALRAARAIASRQGLPGSYANMFAPTRLDFRRGMRVFTDFRWDVLSPRGVLCKLLRKRITTPSSLSRDINPEIAASFPKRIKAKMN